MSLLQFTVMMTTNKLIFIAYEELRRSPEEDLKMDEGR